MPVVVVGAGLMGVGIAQVFAVGGHAVALAECDDARREHAVERMRQCLAHLVKVHVLSAGLAAESVRRLSMYGDSADAVAGIIDGSPLVIVEAVTEDMATKQKILHALECIAPHDTLFCTNTSGLSITEMGTVLERPGNLVGTHFWNPPHLIPVVEVVRGQETDDGVVHATIGLLRSVGKKPVVVARDIPGFIGNRLLHALQKEAMSLVAHGIATAEDIDTVVTGSFGRRLGVLGPLALCDLAGLDLVLDVDRYLLNDLDLTPGPVPLLEELVGNGHIGVRSGQGFYAWTDESVAAAVLRRDEHLISFAVEDRDE